MERTVLFIPPLERISGGLSVLYTLARLLQEAGKEVALCAPGGKAAGLEEAGKEFPLLPFAETSLAPSDLWLVPESWPNAIALGAASGARTVVYAQSWNYLLTTLPAGVRWKQLPVKFLAVSRPVARFMEEVLDVPVQGILPPALAPAFFDAEAARPASPVRVAFMPRKNRALLEQIRQVAEAALASKRIPVEWVALERLAHSEIPARFASCHIYLDAAFPEGFGLPALEAMAAGCVPAGFTGFGGYEYKRHNPAYGPGPVSALPLEEFEGAPNGVYASDGDTLTAGLRLAKLTEAAYAETPDFAAMREAGRETALQYTEARLAERISHIFTEAL